jgi:hypothetical protein
MITPRAGPMSLALGWSHQAGAQHRWRAAVGRRPNTDRPVCRRAERAAPAGRWVAS